MGKQFLGSSEACRKLGVGWRVMHSIPASELPYLEIRANEQVYRKYKIADVDNYIQRNTKAA